ncbi:acyl-CoA Delta-9 desaturase-like [Culicoides brevitarsis]|uniref:acyl-CoA Delta-9 desaturase-like n=1 Tax=Culicoides brevitarsis TaxID=469753 RepID=UPI00307BF0CC
MTATSTLSKHPMKIVWLNLILLVYIHLAAVYGFYLVFTKAKLMTNLFALFLIPYSALGISAGAHRLWCHKTYKAKTPLRIFMMILQTTAHQGSIYDWSRDHRVHHKYMDTDADPYNAKRGFFFSHIGWLMVKKHPDVVAKGKCIDMSDLEADPVVMFQRKYFIPLMILCCFYLPTYIPVWLWSESASTAFYVCAVFRYVFVLNGVWCVNSVAHIWGMKPYEKSITPSDSTFVINLLMGEGWHNFHHVFPWDYRSSELGSWGFNWSTALIEIFAKMGWAYELKTASDEMIRKRVLRTGDGSHELYSKEVDINQNIQKFEPEENDESIWGWDDKDLRDKSRVANIYYDDEQELTTKES